MLVRSRLVSLCRIRTALRQLHVFVGGAGWIYLLVILLLSSACNLSGSPAFTPTPAPSPTVNNTPTPIPLPTLTPLPTPVPDVLFVDAGQSLGPISPLVYGTNHGPWAVVSLDLLPLAESAGITYLRFPGGNWGEENDLKEYHIDQFVELARRMGAEPSISVRLRGGDPEKATELVRYANKAKGYNIRYWSIGNEPALYGDYDTLRYNTEWRAIAEAMLDVDPNIVLVGPDITQFTGNPETDPRDEAGRDWLREFLKANGDLVDIVAIHRYPFPTSIGGPPATVEDMQTNSREWDSIIPNLRAAIREESGRDLPVAITEVNSHWNSATGGPATPDSFYNAVWWGDVLGRMINHQVELVAQFALQSNNRVGGWGLLARYEARPTYYVYQLYQRFGRQLLYASSDDADISIYAALRDDGALTLMLVNLGAKEQTRPLQLSNFNPGGPAEVWLLDANHQAKNVGRRTVVSGEAITLPPQSISLYVIP